MSSKTKWFIDSISGTVIGAFVAVCLRQWFMQDFDSLWQDLFTVVMTGLVAAAGKIKIEESRFSEIVASLLGVEAKTEEDVDNESKKSNVKVKKIENSLNELEDVSESIITDITSNVILFDEINTPEYYQFVLDYLSADGFFNDFGNPELLSWDFEFMSEVGDIINRLYGDKIVESTNDGSTILATLVAEAGIYALVNKKKEVGCTEIINSIKNWTQYLNLNEKINIFNTINEETDCSYHPYHKNKVYTKTRGNIIEFRGPSSHL